MAVAVAGIVVCDLLFAFDSTPVMLSVTRVPLLLVTSQVIYLHVYIFACIYIYMYTYTYIYIYI